MAHDQGTHWYTTQLGFLGVEDAVVEQPTAPLIVKLAKMERRLQEAERRQGRLTASGRIVTARGR